MCVYLKYIFMHICSSVNSCMFVVFVCKSLSTDSMFLLDCAVELTILAVFEIACVCMGISFLTY